MGLRWLDMMEKDGKSMFNDDLSTAKNRFKSYRFKQQNGDVISKHLEFTGRRDVSQKNKRQELELILVPSAFDQRNLGFQKLVVMICGLHQFNPNWVGNTGPTGTPTSNEYWASLLISLIKSFHIHILPSG